MPPPTPANNLPLLSKHASGAAWLFALDMTGLGRLSISDSHFVKAADRGMTVATDGVSTQWLGDLQINPGLMMLGLAILNRHAALPCPALHAGLCCAGGNVPCDGDTV